MEFIWRRRYAGDPCNRLLHAMHHIIYDNGGGNDENVDPNNIVWSKVKKKIGGSYTKFEPQILVLVNKEERI